jgi:hypothetical protein
LLGEDVKPLAVADQTLQTNGSAMVSIVARGARRFTYRTAAAISHRSVRADIAAMLRCKVEWLAISSPCRTR